MDTTTVSYYVVIGRRIQGEIFVVGLWLDTLKSTLTRIYCSLSINMIWRLAD